MEENFVSPISLVKRDTNIEDIDVWQIQANKNDNFGNIIYIGKFSYIPITPITKFEFEGYSCDLMSYSITKDEVNNKKLKMIGFVISKSEKIFSTLDLYFVPDIQLEIDGLRSETRIKGHFEVIFETKNSIIKVKEYAEYIGREESIYVLTDLLTDSLNNDE